MSEERVEVAENPYWCHECQKPVSLKNNLDNQNEADEAEKTETEYQVEDRRVDITCGDCGSGFVEHFEQECSVDPTSVSGLSGSTRPPRFIEHPADFITEQTVISGRLELSSRMTSDGSSNLSQSSGQSDTQARRVGRGSVETRTPERSDSADREAGRGRERFLFQSLPQTQRRSRIERHGQDPPTLTSDQSVGPELNSRAGVSPTSRTRAFRRRNAIRAVPFLTERFPNQAAMNRSMAFGISNMVQQVLSHIRTSNQFGISQSSQISVYVHTGRALTTNLRSFHNSSLELNGGSAGLQNSFANLSNLATLNSLSNLRSFPALANLAFGGSLGDGTITNYEQLLHELLMAGPGSRGTPPTGKRVLQKLLDSKRLVSKEDVTTKLDCAVCKDWMAEGTFAIELDCSHTFCEDCILPWLKQRNSCPVCRLEMETDDVEYETFKKHRTANQTAQQGGMEGDEQSMALTGEGEENGADEEQRERSSRFQRANYLPMDARSSNLIPLMELSSHTSDPDELAGRTAERVALSLLDEIDSARNAPTETENSNLSLE